MKILHNSIIKFSLFSIFSLIAFNTFSQSAASSASFDDKVNLKVQKGYVNGAEIGSLICQDENGNRIVCSGSETETILGFATNIPYVTINKPSNPEDKSKQFSAIAGGSVKKGDLLVAGTKGTVIPGTTGSYAIAMEDAVSGQTFKVKLVK